MALQNNLRVQVDKPVWEWNRFAPAVSSALSCTCAADNSNFNTVAGRYLYYLIGTGAFWRYDTWSDSYQQLTSPPTAPVTASSMRFAGSLGYKARVISIPSSTTMQIAGYNGKALIGFDVKIVGGTGIGQRRQIVAVDDPVVADSGVPTAVAAGSITDTTKAWTINQWVGYQVRITHGVGVGQVRKILYNDATSITFLNTAKYSEELDCNPPLSVALSVAAGSQSLYAIESHVATIDSAWSITPDTTSRILVQSGSIFLMSGAAAAPFYTLQQYDVASDTWYIKNATANLLPAAFSDLTLERQTENSTVFEHSTATGGTATSLIDTTQNFLTGPSLVGKYLRIYSGTGAGTLRLISAATATTLTISSGTAPDATSKYIIEGFDSGGLSSATATVATDSSKTWSTDRWKNYAITLTGGTGAGQTRQILSNTSTAITVYKAFSPTPDATTTYSISGDVTNLYVMFGAFSIVGLHHLDSDFTVTGRVFDSGSVGIGQAQYSDHPPIAIASIAGATSAKTVTTVNPHNYKTGFTVAHTGDTGASAVQNNISAVITVTGATTYTYTATGSTAAATFGTLSTTLLIDATKNWTVNQWVGYLVCFNSTQGPAGTGLVGQITSNTVNSLTLIVAASAAPVNGVSRYVIMNRAPIGTHDHGVATGAHSTTTLQDTTKTWVVNQWAGKRLKMLGATGQGIEVAITSNTANTLTFGITTAPVNNTPYAILQPMARGTGTNLQWAYGASVPAEAGKYMYSPRGGAQLGWDKLNISTDQWLSIASAPQFDTLTSGSMYAYDGGDRIYYTKEVTQRVYYLDLKTHWVHTAGLYPYVAGAAIIGNRMEIYQTLDGLKYLWLNRHSNVECFSQLVFY
jgi:hypothetical protein